MAAGPGETAWCGQRTRARGLSRRTRRGASLSAPAATGWAPRLPRRAARPACGLPSSWDCTGPCPAPGATSTVTVPITSWPPC